jgi:hypothetical protein
MKIKTRNGTAQISSAVTESFRSGATVPHSGTYSVSHSHPLIRETSLLRGRLFPTCPQCYDLITFTLVNQVAVESASSRFRLLMAR